MFDDPNYTKTRAGSGLGALLQNYSTAAGNKDRLKLAERELSMKDPNRQPGLMDLLSIVGDIYKTQSVYAGIPGYNYTAQPFDPQQFQQIFTGLKTAMQPGGAPAAPAPAAAAMPNIQMPSPSGGNPQFLTPQQLQQQNQPLKVGRFSVNQVK